MGKFTFKFQFTPFNPSPMKKERLDFCGKSIKSVVIDICLDNKEYLF